MSEKNMTFPYCLPIQCNHADQVLKNIDRNLDAFSFFEVWLGAVTDLDDDLLNVLLRLHAPTLIVVLRTKGLEITLPLKRRKFFMHEMAGSPALLDLDITVQRAEIRYLEKTALPIKTILSYHNYQETPSTRKLRSLAASMATHNASVIKIATMCQSPSDALRLLDLGQELKAQGREHIVLGMGEHGAVTRIFGTLWGNKMVFAPRNIALSSAPGQLTRDQLDSILSILPS